MTNLGVVACETLYPDVESLVPDAEVRYVPQEYHEFPISVPRDAEIADRVQDCVDALDGPDRDRIVVLYARTSDGLEGVSSTHAPLVVSRVDDCISVFTRRLGTTTTGEAKERGSYYLTRGWIDCGVDCYKLYKAYLGEESDLLAEFERREDDRRVTWNDGDRYRRAVERGRSTSERTVGRFFHRIVGHYERVVLLDTGHLGTFDHEYAETFRSFVERLKAERGDGESVELSAVEGDRSVLATILGEDAHESEFVDVYPPGTAVQ